MALLVVPEPRLCLNYFQFFVTQSETLLSVMFTKACVHVMNHIFLAFLIFTLGPGESEKVGPGDIGIPRPFLVSLVYKARPLFEEK